MKEKTTSKVLRHTLVILGLVVMLYPLAWLVSSSFKTNEEIFAATNLLPKEFSFAGYINGWTGTGKYTYTDFFKNSFTMVLPMVAFSVISSAVVAFGFARFEFPLKKVLFAIMIGTMMLPSSVMLIPRYVMFKSLGWTNSYLPMIVPTIFAGTPFFVFMLVQFFRGLPRELDESAYIDGCNSFFLLVRIFVPLSKPALFSVAMFQFMWAWNDFFNPLIYVNSVSKYTLSQGLRLSLDMESNIQWNSVLAMSLVTILPLALLFFFAQKYFVEGVATTGLKG